MSEIEYVVNEEKRSVTAIMTNIEFDALKSLYRMGSEQIKLDNDFDSLMAIKIPNKLIATVRCAAEDTFDVETGKMFARKKLWKKYDRQRTQAWYRYKKLMQKRIDAADKCIEKYWSDYEPPITEADLRK